MPAETMPYLFHDQTCGLTGDYEKIILANKQMADDVLLLEYNILCKIERARIINDYSMVLLLLGD